MKPKSKFIANRAYKRQDWEDIKSQKAFIKNFNTAMNKAFEGFPKARAEFGNILEQNGIKLTLFGNVSMSNATGSFKLGLAKMGFGKEHYNIEKASNIEDFRKRMDYIQENRPLDDVYADKIFIENLSEKLDFYYNDQIYNGKSEEEMSDIINEIAPELKTQKRKRLSYAQLREAFEKLQKAGIV